MLPSRGTQNAENAEYRSRGDRHHWFPGASSCCSFFLHWRSAKIVDYQIDWFVWYWYNDDSNYGRERQPEQETTVPCPRSLGSRLVPTTRGQWSKGFDQKSAASSELIYTIGILSIRVAPGHQYTHGGPGRYGMTSSVTILILEYAF